MRLPELDRVADMVLNYRHDPKCTTAPKPKKKAKKAKKKAINVSQSTRQPHVESSPQQSPHLVEQQRRQQSST